jgi:N-acetylglucosamine-6-phosphate deacetylase
MLVLTGADLVLSDRVVPSGTLSVNDGRIASMSDALSTDPAAVALDGCIVIPGLVDVHIHGVDGIDSLDDGETIARMAARLPRYGVTAFCPTTVACAPRALVRVLEQIRDCRSHPCPGARVLPAHLETNFINPLYAGAQPRTCLRAFETLPGHGESVSTRPSDGEFTAADVLQVIEEFRDQIAIATIAAEMPGGLKLVSWLARRGVRVSLGHSASSYDEALVAIDRGARHATHLFNRMPPFHHRDPGLVGAVLDRDEVAAEVICDGAHVHASLVRMALALKGTARLLAITDGTSMTGCPAGAAGSLGGQSITAGDRTALLDDGTMAGSVIAMDAAFRWLSGPVGLSLVDAATVCSTTPARAVDLSDAGALEVGAAADLTVLDDQRRVVRTYVGGRLVYQAPDGRSRTEAGV